MGANEAKYNINGNINIKVVLNKVCYFPGENMTGRIQLISNKGFIQECKKFSEIIITITQISQYKYPSDSHDKIEKEVITLMNNIMSFSDFIQMGEERVINIPFNYTCPKNACPSIFLSDKDYIKHVLSIDYPHFNVRRSYIFVVKNKLEYHSILKNLLCPFKNETIFNKSKFFSKKGSCKLIIDMPRNYFLYNEKVEFNIQIDCSSLKIPVNKIRLSFDRAIKKNYKNDYLNTRKYATENLIFKEYNLEKTKKIFNIVDYIYFPKHTAKFSATDAYKNMNNHGLYEVTDETLKNLYPCCSIGLINIEYSITVKIFFDSMLTTDEEKFFPIFFCDILGDNNQNKYNPPSQTNISYSNNTQNNNYLNQLPTLSEIQANTHTPDYNTNSDNNIQNYNINNIANNDNNIADDEGAAPTGFNINMDSKKNY